MGGGGGREAEEARAVIPYWRRQMIRAGQLTHEMRLVFSSGIGNFQAITISESRVIYGPVDVSELRSSALRVMWSVNQIFPVKKVGIVTYLSHCFCIFSEECFCDPFSIQFTGKVPLFRCKNRGQGPLLYPQHNHSLNSDLIENKTFSF